MPFGADKLTTRGCSCVKSAAIRAIGGLTFLPRLVRSAVFAGRAASIDQPIQFIYERGIGREFDRMSFLQLPAQALKTRQTPAHSLLVEKRC